MAGAGDLASNLFSWGGVRGLAIQDDCFVLRLASLHVPAIQVLDGGWVACHLAVQLEGQNAKFWLLGLHACPPKLVNMEITVYRCFVTWGCVLSLLVSFHVRPLPTPKLLDLWRLCGWLEQKILPLFLFSFFLSGFPA